MPKIKPIRRILSCYTQRSVASRVFFVLLNSLFFTPVFFYTRIRGCLHARKLATLSVLALLVIFSSFTFSQLKPATANALTDSTVNFQARLESSTGSIVPDGSYNIEFKLYNALTSSGSSQGSCTGDSACLWTEDYLNSASQGVSVVDGYLSVNLGSITSFPTNINWSQPLYLTMNIGGTSNPTPVWDGEMTPRLGLNAVPYAFQAGSAAELQNTSGSNVATLTQTTPTGTDNIVLPDASGTVCLDSTTACGYIQNTATSKTGNFNVQAATGGSVAGVLEANSSGTGDILDLLNGSGVTVASFGYTGNVLFKASTNSGSAFQIQGSSSTTPLLTADTTNMRISIGSGGTATGQLYVAGTGGTLLGATQVGTSGQEDTDEQISGHYLYINNYTAGKLAVYDVTNPSSPALIGTPITLNSSPTGMALSGHYLYIANYGSSTMQVVDISNPYAPSVVGSVTTDTYPGEVTVVGRYAYVATASGVDVIDISNPTKPVKITTISTTNASIQLVASGRYVYVGEVGNGTHAYMQAIDTTSNTVVGTYTLAGGSSANMENSSSAYGLREMAIQGRYVYVSNIGNKTIDVFDVSNPAAGGSPVTSISTGTEQPYSLSAQGRYLYASLSTADATPAALTTYDISNVSSITQVNSTTSTYPGETLLTQGRYAYQTGYDGHLEVFDLGGSYIQQLETGGLETGTLSVDDDANFNGNASIAGGVQIGQSLEVTGNEGVSGSLLVQTATNSSSALKVENSSGTQVLNVDTTNSILSVQGANSDAVIGSEKMTSTTNFSSGWTGTGWTFSSSSAAHTSGTSPAVYSGFTPVAGTTYQITYTFSGASGNGMDGITPNIGGVSGLLMYSTGTTDTQVITTTGTGSLEFIPTTAWAGSITSVSVKTVTASNAILQVLSSSGLDQIQVRSSANNPIDEFIGYEAGQDNSTGNDLTATGYMALQENTSGYSNTAYGGYSLQNNTSGYSNSAFGLHSLQNNTSGFNNAALGGYSLQYNTTGYSNSAFGLDSLQDNTIGYGNAGLGDYSLQDNTIGYDSTAVGQASLQDNTTGNFNAALGTSSLQDNTTGDYNSALGSFALNTETTGGSNTAVGQAALSDENGQGNTAIGMTAGETDSYNDTNGTQNTYIGIQSGPNTATALQNATAIGTSSTVGESNALVLGCISGINSCTATTKVGIGTPTPSSILDVEGSQNSQFSLIVNNSNTGSSATSTIQLGASSYITQNSSSNTSNGGTNSLNINNATSGGTIAIGISGVSNEDITNTGSTKFKDSTDSASGFVVQNAGGTQILNVNSTASTVTVEGSSTSSGTVGSNIVTNGTNFSSGWTGTGWTFNSSSATHSSGTTAAKDTAVTLATGTTYELVFTFSGATNNGVDNITPALGDVLGSPIYDASDTNETYLISTDSNVSAGLQFIPTTAWAGSITSVALYPITNDNAELAVTDSTGANGSPLEVRTSSSNSDLFVGKSSGEFNTTGQYNLSVGEFSLESNTSGSANTALGTQALQNNTSGYDNGASGFLALQDNVSGYDNNADGAYALQDNTTGYENQAIGFEALQDNENGYDNSAVGAYALQDNTTGYNNTAVGYGALIVNTTGVDNNAIGTYSLLSNTSGYDNEAVGNETLQFNITGHDNAAVGDFALGRNTTGTQNAALGSYALDTNSTGSQNVALGVAAGVSNVFANGNTSGSNNVFLGTNSGPGSTLQVSDSSAIGFDAVVSENDAISIGCVSGVNNCPTTTMVGIDDSTPGNLLSIGALTTAASTYQIAVSTGGTTNSGIVVQTVASQSSGYVFQAQNSSGTLLAGIDYQGNLTVKSATITGTLTVNGHIVTANTSGTTSATVQTAAGSTATCTLSGDDTSGLITIASTGTGQATGNQCTIGFSSSYGANSHPVVTSTASNGIGVGAYLTPGTANFKLNFTTAPTAGQTYTFDYFNAQ